MTDNPILDEIHRYRREHAKRFGYDLRKMVEDIQRRQKQSGRPTVSFAPKRPAHTARS